MGLAPSPCRGWPMAPFRLRPREYRGVRRLLGQTRDAAQWRRAQGLLWLHEGRPITEVAGLLRVSRQTLYNWAQVFTDRADLDPAQRLLDAPRSGRPATALGIIDPLLDAVIDGDPRDYGYR